MANDDWYSERRCLDLTPQQADAMFFPGSGGKPTKANEYCSGCSVQRDCLIEAIESGLSGFWAGTTDAARAVMARSFHVKLGSIEDVMPPEPKARRIYRHVIITSVTTTVDYLDTLEGPTL